MIRRLGRLINTPIEEEIFLINESLRIYSSEYLTTEEISQIIFQQLISSEISSRIIKYTYNNKPFYSVQYYNKGKWHNFNYDGLDMFFHPIYHKTLNPTNIVEEWRVEHG